MATYDHHSWDVYTPLPVSPSVLYPLVPHGVGTPLVESLTSYVKRLAQSHHLKVADFITFCSTQTDVQVLPSTLQKLSRIDGITLGARSWSQLLRNLTGRDEALCLTMDYWRPLLNPFRLLRQLHAWCPMCYAEAVRQNHPLYEPLSWRLQCVEVCTVHACRLENACPHCGRQFTTLSNRAVVGFCPKCRHWLGDTTTVVGAETEACVLAKGVGQLLELMPRLNPEQIQPIPQMLYRLKQRQQVSYRELERILNIGLTSLTTMTAGQRLPNLEVVLRLALFSGEPLEKTLVQPLALAPTVAQTETLRLHTPFERQTYLERCLAAPERLPGLAQLAQTCGFSTVFALRKAFPDLVASLWQRIHEEQRQSLEDALRQELPVVLSEWAHQHGYEPGDLYHHFYELCRQVTHRFHTRKEARCRQALQTFLEGDALPTFTAIQKALGVSNHYLRRHFAPELQRLEALRQRRWRDKETEARDLLSQMLAADTGTYRSLNQLAEDLGVSAKYLKHAFPSESRLLIDRRRASIAQQVEATCLRIRQLVFELHQQGIYPSVDRIHAVIHTWMVHGKAYRQTYIDAMTVCGYPTNSTSQPF